MRLKDVGETERYTIRKLVLKNGQNQKKVAIGIGMRYGTFNQKLNGLQVLTQEEVNRIIAFCEKSKAA